MNLRWQNVGERAHALDADHQPLAYETFRALCGRYCEVWPDDVQPRPHRWKFWGGPGWLDMPHIVPCRDCDHIWAAMDELGTHRKVAAG